MYTSNNSHFPELKSHLLTNNLVIRQQIVRDNIARYMNYKESKEYKNLNSLEKEEIENIINYQHLLLKNINISISHNPQLDLL